MSLITKMRSNMINKFYNNGFDADNYYDIIVKGKSRYTITQEAAQEEVAKIDDKTLSNIDKPLKILIIGSPMCSDTAIAVPSFIEIYKKMKHREYSIADKREMEEDFINCFKVGSKGTVPQILFANREGEIINKWIEKSTIAKNLLKEVKELGLDSKAKRERLLTTPELHSSREAKFVVNELVDMAQKAIHYI